MSQFYSNVCMYVFIKKNVFIKKEGTKIYYCLVCLKRAKSELNFIFTNTGCFIECSRINYVSILKNICYTLYDKNVCGITGKRNTTFTHRVKFCDTYRKQYRDQIRCQPQSYRGPCIPSWSTCWASSSLSFHRGSLQHEILYPNRK